MLGSVESFARFRDLKAGTFADRQLVIGNRQKYIGRLKFEISCQKRRQQLSTVAYCKSRGNLADSIAKGGKSFANRVSQILRHRSVSSNIQKLPVFYQKDGQQFQFAWDGNSLCTIPAHPIKEESIPGSHTHGLAPQKVQIIVERIGITLYRTFVPDNVRPHYLVYMKWKFLHRLSSSVIQVQGTQAMLQAIGIGARRSLPAAAGLNWVLKDGLGRLGRFAFSGLLGHTFDSNLKKVRFSTSVLFSFSLGLEMLTPFFPDSFLLLATLANIGKSIALAAYLATSSAIHRSFAVGDNLANIAAKGQVQTVVADNLGLAVAMVIGNVVRLNKWLRPVLLFVIFPILAGLDLYAIYQELQSVHLQTLNKARLEIIVDGWLCTGQVHNVEEVSKVECKQLLKIIDQKFLPLRIGALNPQGRNPNDILQAFDYQTGQPYAFFKEAQCFMKISNQTGLLLWLHEGFTAKDVITAVLQAGLIRSIAPLESWSSTIQEDSWKPILDVVQMQDKVAEFSENDMNSDSRRWHSVIATSRGKAEATVDDLIATMESSGWQTQHILLDPQERQAYSTQLGM